MNANKLKAIGFIRSALVILEAGGDGSEILLRSALDELTSIPPPPSTPVKTGYAPCTEAPERPVKSATKRPVQNAKVPKMATTISSAELTPDMNEYINRIINLLLTRDEMKDAYVNICHHVRSKEFEIDGKPIKSSDLLNRIALSDITFSRLNEQYKIVKRVNENQSLNGYGLERVSS
jgi:hypothetical protein